LGISKFFTKGINHFQFEFVNRTKINLINYVRIINDLNSIPFLRLFMVRVINEKMEIMSINYFLLAKDPYEKLD
jgi:hypothetical protein